MVLTVEDIICCNYKLAIDCFAIETDESGQQTNYVCRVNSCEQKYKSKSASIRHLRINHSEIFKEIQLNKSGEKLQQSQDDVLGGFLEIRVKVRPADIWNACVDLIAFNGLALSVVDSPAFKKILEPYVTALKRHGVDLVINRNNIKPCIGKRAKEIKDSIAFETKKKMVAVMLDIASRYNRAVLGVNIAYFHAGHIQIKTIGMHVLHYSHTAAHIKDTLVQNLLDFNIRLEQILSVTTDSGKNLLKMIADMNSELEGQDIAEAESDEEEFIDNTIFDASYYDDLISKVQSMFNEANHTSLIHGVPCAAHCPHLVVTHAFTDLPDTTKLIEKCRNLAKKLRTPSLRTILKSFGCNMAQIDVSTRWNSIYSMVGI